MQQKFPMNKSQPRPRGDKCHFKGEQSGSNATWTAIEQKIPVQAREGRNYYDNCKEDNGETIGYYDGRIVNAPKKAISRVP